MAVFNRAIGGHNDLGVWERQPGGGQALGELPSVTMKGNDDRCEQAGSFYPQSFRQNQTEVALRADNLRVEECMRSPPAQTGVDRMSGPIAPLGPTLAF